MRALALALLLWCPVLAGMAQQVTHGPLTGGTQDTAVVVYLRTSAATAFNLEVATDAAFSNIVATVADSTLAANDTSALVPVTGLQPRTEYFVRANIGGTASTRVGRFRTFPAVDTPSTAANPYKLLGGSCLRGIEGADSAMFAALKSEDADIMTFYGDWNYPDAATDFIAVYEDGESYADNVSGLQRSYRDRYEALASRHFITTTNLDWTWDDHDYLNDNSGKDWIAVYQLPAVPFIFNAPQHPTLSDLGAPFSIPANPNARRNLIDAYTKYFPHYPLPDTAEGIYHSYRLGNAEVFVLDARANRGSQNDEFRKVNGRWVYDPDTSFTMLGRQQRDWLINGLINSTADWKIIVSSVTFNLSNRIALDSTIALGDQVSGLYAEQFGNNPLITAIAGRGFIDANRLADKWCGFPADQDALMTAIVQNDIRNLVLISGDTHNSAIDDGTNSGIPELMAAQLKVSNRFEALQLERFLGYNIWNRGGSGLGGEDNFSTNYGKIEIYGRDSICLSVVDPTGDVIANYCQAYNAPRNWQGGAPPYTFPTPNFRPTGLDDDFSVPEDVASNLGVLTNDSDPENDSLYVLLTTPPSNGTAQVDAATQQVTYQPNTGFSGADGFNYKVCENSNPNLPSCSDEVVVTINVSGQTTAVVPASQAPGLRVFPNPANRQATIQLLAPTGQAFRFELMDATGRVLQTLNVADEARLNTGELPGGWYLYRLADDRGQVRHSGKLNVLHR